MYESLLTKLLLPAYDRVRGRPGHTAYVAEYDANQWVSPASLEALQLRKLNALLAHAWETVPYLRERWAAVGLSPEPLHSVADLDTYPVISKADITTNYSGMISTLWRGRTKRKTTGGSTGQPFGYEFNEESDSRRNAVMWRGYGWAGSRPGVNTLYLWSAPSSANRFRRLKDRLYHKAFNREFVDSFGLTEASLAAHAERIDRASPDIVVGYVSALSEISRWARQVGRPLHRPRAVITGAEALAEVDRSLIGSAFGCAVFNTYGCREVMLIASECSLHSGLHVNQDHLVVETLSESGVSVKGVVGRVLLTDLHNYAMPLIRYENGDAAILGTRACECGRSLPLLEKVEGRTLDMIRTRDGRLLPGEYFPHNLKDVSGLVEFQVIQESLDVVRVLVVTDNRSNHETLSIVEAVVREGVGPATRVTIEQVQRISRTPSGKRRVTVSQLPRQTG